MRRLTITAAALILCASGCGGDEETRTVTVTDRQPAAGLKRLAYRELEALSRRTCAAVPRDELVKALASVSDDAQAEPPRPYTDNDIALFYAEDVSIQRLRLQQAAYDGCMEGLKKNPR